jgi:2,4-dienoyl-CoA reductase-like NADH-dependent reductase (Old Yellow Enzyme family)
MIGVFCRSDDGTQTLYQCSIDTMRLFERIFQPLPLSRGDIALPNRVVMGPMTLNQATEDGHITPWITDWYKRRAAGGVGTLIGAAVFVSQNGRGWPNAVGIADDSYTEGWADCVRVAHENGALFGTQLFHSSRFPPPIGHVKDSIPPVH